MVLLGRELVDHGSHISIVPRIHSIFRLRCFNILFVFDAGQMGEGLLWVRDCISAFHAEALKSIVELAGMLCSDRGFFEGD